MDAQLPESWLASHARRFKPETLHSFLQKVAALLDTESMLALSSCDKFCRDACASMIWRSATIRDKQSCEWVQECLWANRFSTHLRELTVDTTDREALAQIHHILFSCPKITDLYWNAPGIETYLGEIATNTKLHYLYPISYSDLKEALHEGSFGLLQYKALYSVQLVVDAGTTQVVRDAILETIRRHGVPNLHEVHFIPHDRFYPDPVLASASQHMVDRITDICTNPRHQFSRPCLIKKVTWSGRFGHEKLLGSIRLDALTSLEVSEATAELMRSFCRFRVPEHLEVLKLQPLCLCGNTDMDVNEAFLRFQDLQAATKRILAHVKPLRELSLAGLYTEAIVADALTRHGPTLEKLSLKPASPCDGHLEHRYPMTQSRWIELYEPTWSSVKVMTRACPRLWSLAIPFKRAYTNPLELLGFEDVGRQLQLREITLYLYSRGEFWRQYLDYSPDDIKNDLANLAIDETLAKTIYTVLASQRNGREFELTLDASQGRLPVAYPWRYVFTEIGRTWKLSQRRAGVHARKVPVDMDRMGNGPEAVHPHEIEAMVGDVWPRAAGRGWRQAWYGFPLLGWPRERLPWDMSPVEPRATVEGGERW